MTESEQRVPGSPYTLDGEEPNTGAGASKDVPSHAGDVVEGEVGSARLKEPSHIEPPDPDADLVSNDPVVDLSDAGA